MYPMSPDQENNIQAMRNYWNTHPEIRGINPVTFWLHMYYVHAMHTFIPGISKNPMYVVSESKLLEDIVSYRTRTEESIVSVEQKARLIREFIDHTDEFNKVHHQDVIDALKVIAEKPEYLSATVLVNDGSFRTNRIILSGAEYSICSIEKNGKDIPNNIFPYDRAESAVSHILEEDGVIFVQLIPKEYTERVRRYPYPRDRIGYIGGDPYWHIGPFPSI